MGAANAATDGPLDSRDAWWGSLQELCGQSFAGGLVSSEDADQEMVGIPMVMHVRSCTPDRVEIPFHIGENRSRTWLLTRVGQEIQLQHDHRHEDGHEDDVSLYGGRTQAQGTRTVQRFPADEYSKELFAQNELQASMGNVWSMELIAGEQFSYVLRRPGRYFQADFDLTHPVPTPPAAWGRSNKTD